MSELGSDCEFRDGVGPLRTLGVLTSFKTVQRVSEKVGGDLADERHGWKGRLEAPKHPPKNKSELMVVFGDGCRIRQVAEPPSNRRPDAEIDDGWRECKVGVVASMLPGTVSKDGSCVPPTALVQSYLATMDGIELFGQKLRAESERRGLKGAREVVLVSDAGHGLPEMWAREFPKTEWVVDFYHVASRLAECAGEVAIPGKATAAVREKWKGMLYDGKVSGLLRSLRFHARRHVDRPEELSALAEGSPGRILWTHVFYIEKYRDHMDYPDYRKRGWPIGSGSVESFAKRIGNRMKAASKRWTRDGAESIATLIAERASGDGRWNQRWPDHVYDEEVVQLN